MSNVAQATWVDVQQQQRVRVTANLPAWALGGSALLLLACAIVATLEAYDRPAALARLAALAAGAALCGLATWIAQIESARVVRLRLMQITGFGAALAVLCIAIFFLVRNPLQGGAYAGALVSLLPVAVLELLHGPRRSRRAGTPAELVAWAALAIGGSALLFSGEENALIALALGGVVGAALLWLAKAQRRTIWLVAAALLLAGLALVAWLALGPALPGWLASRMELWGNALPLIRDYRFTGSGLASTEMVYSSYVLLTHVPFVAHVHNLYLQVALEMGLFGMAALLGIFAAGLAAALQALRYADGSTQWRAAAIIAALVATLALGLVESEVVASLLVTAIFVAPAAALLVQAMARAEAHNAGILEFPARSGPVPELAARPGLWLLIAAVGIVPVLVVWGVSALSSVQAAWEANQGAVLQTQVELTGYAEAEWPFQDAIRRARADALAPAESAYRSALFLDPAQETAHRRMGQIALSLGDLSRAAGFLQEAHRLDPGNRASAQLLGEVRALQGDAGAAAALWLPLNLGQNQIETRINWHRTLGSEEDLARMQAAAILYNQRLQGEAAQ